MNQADLARLYKTHVAERQKKADAALEASGFDALVIHSGTPFRYFADDQEAPFRATPHFAHWLPLEEPEALLLIRPGERPSLVRYVPDDFWREQLPLGDPFWLPEFEFSETSDKDALWHHVRHPMSDRNIAFIGDAADAATARGIPEEALNPAILVQMLDHDRSIKTEYEAACINEANRMALPGHGAARDAFLEGKDELEIHRAYLAAIGTTERDLPYETIVALDEKGAILHYQGKRRGVKGKSLLLDAGARYLGYCSDITRTFAREDAEPLFKELLAGVEKIQQELCGEAKPGLPFSELQKKTHVKIGNVLHELGILAISGEDAVEKKLTNAFFPHGVGHFLGIQVHDVGSTRVKEGETLRNTTVIEAAQVFTIEPGIYFNELLLKPHRTGDTAQHFDWKLVDRLTPYGGVRIEDDIFALPDGSRNLTRDI